MMPVCPHCHVALLILHFKNVEVDFCQRCHGIWFDAGELEELLENTGAVSDDPLLEFQNPILYPPQKSKLLCPRCDLPLDEILVDKNKVQLKLNRCSRNHGLWFDTNELQQLLSMFPLEKGTSKTIQYLNEIFSVKPPAPITT